jgi:hypothetical protein
LRNAVPPPHFALDLARSRPAPAGWAWPLLLVGALATAWQGGRLLDALERRDDQASVLQRLQAALAREHASSRNAAPAAADARATAELARVAAELHRPWWPLLDGVEQATRPPLQLMQLGVDAGFGRLQLQVQAPTVADVTRYVQALDASAGRAPWRSAELAGHEWVGGGDGAAGSAGLPRVVVARIVLPLSGGGR